MNNAAHNILLSNQNDTLFPNESDLQCDLKLIQSDEQCGSCRHKVHFETYSLNHAVGLLVDRGKKWDIPGGSRFSIPGLTTGATPGDENSNSAAGEGRCNGVRL